MDEEVDSRIYSTLKPRGIFLLQDDSFNFPPEELKDRIPEIYAQWEGYFGATDWEIMKRELAGDDFEFTPFLTNLQEMITCAGLEVAKVVPNGLDGVELTATKS